MNNKESVYFLSVAEAILLATLNEKNSDYDLWSEIIGIYDRYNTFIRRGMIKNDQAAD